MGINGVKCLYRSDFNKRPFYYTGGIFFSKTIDGKVITGNETYTSDDEILVTNTTVESSGRLTLKAKNRITLGAGFHVKAGFRLTVQIDPSLQDFYLTNLSPNESNNCFGFEDIYLSHF